MHETDRENLERIVGHYQLRYKSDRKVADTATTPDTSTTQTKCATGEGKLCHKARL
jgi:hypothetical protein